MTNVSRRQALGCAAAVGVGVPLLGACGGGSDDAGGPPSSGTELAKSSDVPVGGAVVLSDRQIILSQPKAGQFKAFSNICTHAHCPITQLTGTTLECGCHHSQFDATTGEVLQGPATQPLDEVVVKVQGGEVVTA